MRDQPEDLPYGPGGEFVVEAADSGVAQGSGPLLTRRTALLGLGATGVLAGLGVLPADPAAAESSPAPTACRQLITVNTGSSRATTGSLSAWTLAADGGWRRTLGPIGCHVGSLGVGRASEGSSITPAGTFPLNVAFGRQPNPGTHMSYFRTDALDWWDENPTSPTYNLHVRRATSPGGNSENLYYSGSVYDYAVNINHNPGRVPYAGSAIFLHVTDGGPTAGCVSIDRASLVSILRWLRPDQHPYASIRVGSAWVPLRVPMDQAQAFVRQVYRSVLGREPSANERVSRGSMIHNGASRRYVTDQIAHSDEKYRRVVTQVYQRVLQRRPAPGPLATRSQTLARGGGLAALYVSLATSDEAWSLAGRNPGRWVDRTCTAMVGRPSVQSVWWQSQLRSHGREKTAAAIAATSGFGDFQLDLVFRDMLGRVATTAEHRLAAATMHARGVFDRPGIIAMGPQFWARSQR